MRTGLPWRVGVRFVFLGLLLLALASSGGCGDDAQNAPDACKPPAVDGTGPVRFDEAVRFIYANSACPRQTGVDESKLDPLRVAVVRGVVRGGDGEPLANAAVTFPGHPEFGAGRTLEDGSFDLVANGGGSLVVRFAAAGKLASQRGVSVPRHQFVVMDDIVLLEPSGQSTDVQFGSSWQVASGETSAKDDAAPRTVRVLFPPNVHATVTKADGASAPFSGGTFRVTEFTRGALGDKAMPGTLPASSAYTYASNFGFDEAEDARGIAFDAPVLAYVDNFLHMKVGAAVPAGAFATDENAWQPEDSGRVIGIVAGTGGAPAIDGNGDGQPDSDAELQALGVLPGELDTAKSVLDIGASYFRVPLRHFSSWDFNWGYAPPSDSGLPPPAPDPNSDNDPCMTQGGSYFACESQTLFESIPVVGTSFSLSYASDRVPGRRETSTVTIPITDATIPGPVKRAELEINVLGKRTTKTFPGPVAPNTRETFIWDGTDGYGRAWPGQAFASVRVGFVYAAAYMDTDTFASWGAAVGNKGPVTDDATRRELTIWRTYDVRVGGGNALGQSFGGWSFSANHAYDVATQTLLYGDGRKRSTDGMGAALDLIAGDGTVASAGDGGPATLAKLDQPQSIAVAADGTTYVAETGAYRIRKIDTKGVITTFAGSGVEGDAGDGAPATAAQIREPRTIALRGDGAVCFTAFNVVRCVTTDGIIHTVVGGGDADVPASGVAARSAGFVWLWGLTFGPDGSMYFADHWQIYKLDPNGATVRTVAGVFQGRGDDGENVPALSADLADPLGLAVDKGGAVYFTASTGHRVRRIDTSGRVTTVAGRGDAGNDGDGGSALSARLNAPSAIAVDGDGTLYISDRTPQVIRRVYKGRISTFAGGGPQVDFAPGMMAKRLDAVLSSGLAIGPDGDLYAVDDAHERVYRLRSPMPKASLRETVIAEEDGSAVHVFDERGRHLRTLDPLTLSARLTFSYDEGGRLSQASDAHGNVTTIQRDGVGRAMAIVAPFGQTTTLEYGGESFGLPGGAGAELVGITDPIGRANRFEYAAGLLLTKRVDPAGGVHTMQYDEMGLLTRDANAENATWSLARESASPRRVRVTTGMSRVRVHEQASYADQDETRALTREDGTKTAWTVGLDGSEHVTSADGTQTDTLLNPDPRFGMQAPYIGHSVVTLPSGLSRTGDAAWNARFAPDGSLAGLDGKQTTVDGEGASSYDAASHTWTSVSPGGRQTTTVFDGEGRLVHVQSAGLLGRDIRYDERGRIAQVTQGARHVAYGYDGASGALRGIQDALGPVVTFDRDPALRTTQSTSADGARTAFAYDALDDVIALTPPGKPAHATAYAKDGLETSYTAPGAAPLLTGYDPDRTPSFVTHEDGAQTSVQRDGAGRPVATHFAGGTVATAYDGRTGQVTSLTGPGSATLRFAYDGALRTSVTAAGAAPGSVGWTYDAMFRPQTETLSGGGGAIDYGYDADGLLTAAGPVAMTHEPATGFVSSLSAAGVSAKWTYSPYGEVATYQASSAAGPLLDVAYTYDARGRMVEKHENGAVWGYAYDALNRVTRVTKGGAEQASYTYDANGNRTDGGAQVDAQDRLTHRGDATYTYTPRGERATKQTAAGTTTYGYDGRGNLVSVQLASGVHIDYQLDALGRRITRSRNGAVTHRWLYRSGLQPVAEVDASGNVVTQFIYARGRNVPDAMVRGGATYALVTDHLGSVRFVVDSSGGAAQSVDYDPWGHATSDSKPGFQPFGFAGGISDPDTGLVHFGAREYDPESGIWTSKDPSRFWGGLNLYAYCDNDPVNWIDPRARMKLPPTPSGLGPEWVQDPQHRPPHGGGRWFAPDGSGLEFHPGRPGAGGDQEDDHWHRVVNGKKQKKHLSPGAEVPDPAPVCQAPNESPGTPEDPTDEYTNDYAALPPWLFLIPFAPWLGPLGGGAEASPWLIPAFGF